MFPAIIGILNSGGAETYQGVIKGDDPVLYYRLEETAGPTAIDQTGTQNGTYSGTPVFSVTGKVDDCVTFDGSTDYITVGTNSTYAFERTNSFSLEAWFKHPDNSGGSRRCLFSRIAGGSAEVGWSLYLETSGAIMFNLNYDITTPNAIEVESPSGYDDDAWHHVVCTYAGDSDADNVHMIIDGIDVSLTINEDNLSINLSPSGETLYIGRDQSGVTGVPNGELDEMAIYDTELTVQQARDHYHAAEQTYTSLILKQGPEFYWKLGDQSGTTAVNHLGVTARDGTYGNTPTLQATGLVSNNGSDDAVTFTASQDEYVTLADTSASWANPDPLTVSFWFQTTSTTEREVFTKSDSPGYQWGVAIGDQLSATQWQCAGTGFRTTSTGVEFTTSTTYHVVCVIGSAATKLYIDGDHVLTSTTTNGTWCQTSNSDFYLARRGDGASAGFGDFDGTLDEVCFFSKELTPTEIKEQYLMGK